MEPYMKDFFFTETMVVPPKYLNSDLYESLRLMVLEKYGAPNESPFGRAKRVLIEGAKPPSFGRAKRVLIEGAKPPSFGRFDEDVRDGRPNPNPNEQSSYASYPTSYLDKGFIFDIQVASVVNNRISPYGQIVLEVQFASRLYSPTIGHVFRGRVHTSQRYRWIQIGPLLIYFVDKVDQDEVTVRITSVKSDNTTCYGNVVL